MPAVKYRAADASVRTDVGLGVGVVTDGDTVRPGSTGVGASEPSWIASTVPVTASTATIPAATASRRG